MSDAQNTNPEVENLKAEGAALMLQAEQATGSQADDLRAQAEALFAKAKQTAQEWSEKAEAKTKELADQTSTYVKENPLKAVGLAAAVGVLLGALFKRK